MPQSLLAPVLPAAGSAELPHSSFAPHSSSPHPEDTVSVFLTEEPLDFMKG